MQANKLDYIAERLHKINLKFLNLEELTMHRQEYSISRIATLTYSRVRELPLSVTVHRVTLMHSTLRRAALT